MEFAMARPGRVLTTISVAGVIGLVLGMVEAVHSYQPETHRAISTTAVDRSNLDLILKTQFGVDEGIRFAINGEIVRAWIGIGANLEDAPPVRSLNHFHSPLRPWADAGGPLGQSSVYWQQNPNQGLGGTWSWPVARQRLLDFLTLPGPAAREQALADTARALGQVIHLVQDAASPAHTREDPHLIHDGYEARIEELRASLDATLRSRFASLLAAPSTLPATSIFTSTGDPQAPGPVARLIDSDGYRGTVQTYAIGAQAGLSEYTSGGYVSDDTIFLGFALPRRESLGPATFDPPVDTPGARRYFPKTTDGDTIAHFVAEGALYERLLFRGQLVGGFILDDRVYEDYAAQLIPRAVGYSAGLLDYFFRSNFDFAVDVSSSDPGKRLLTISIPPVLSAETMDGTFTLYAEDRDGRRSAVPGASLTTVLSRGALAQTVFTPVAGVRAYVLVFRGGLGNEPGAVTGKVKPMGPFVSVLQATAEFAGEEERTTVTEVDNASTLILLERRSNDERQQRARGTFVSSTPSDPGQHLKRVSLEFDPRMVGAPAVRLLLDDVDVGVAWNREASIVENPSRWEVRVDLPVFYGGAAGILVPNVPRFVAVETVEGIKTRTPLVWWRSAASLAEARAGRESVTACRPELQCEEVVSTSTILKGLVFFGDGNGEGRDATAAGQRQPLTVAHTSVGFIPIGAVAGYAVGTVEQSGNLNCFGGCTPVASCSTSTVAVFTESAAEGPVWTKDEFSISLGNLSGVRKPGNACARPAAGQPAAPDLPELRFRRDYLPAELSRFQELGVTPPEYEITLR
jgi:hypothetical protein